MRKSKCISYPQAIGIKLLERLSMMSEQYLPKVQKWSDGGEFANGIFGCLKAVRPHARRYNRTLPSESACRELWEVPAFEVLLVGAPCSARSSSNAARGPGQLFVFEDVWVFASTHRAEARNR